MAHNIMSNIKTGSVVVVSNPNPSSFSYRGTLGKVVSVRNIEDCTDEEISILYKAYTMGEILDDDAIGYICEREGYKHILYVEYEGNKATIKFSDNSTLVLDLDVTGQDPEDVDSMELKEWMMGEGADEPSAEYWSEQIECHFSK